MNPTRGRLAGSGRRRARRCAALVAAIMAAGSVQAVTYAAPPAKFHPARPHLGTPTPTRRAPAATGAAAAAAPSAALPAAEALPRAADYRVALTAGWTVLGTSDIAVARRAVRTGSAVRSVDARVLDRASARRYGQSGLALQLARTDHGSVTGLVSVRVPTRLLNRMYGADFAARVRWVARPAGEPNATPQQVTATPDPASGSLLLSAAVGAAPLVLAAASAPTAANGTGSWAASPLSPAAAWQVSAQTGDFSWSDPLRVPPPAAGPAPGLALSYDSGSVDGETGSTNNQPSAVGEGWVLSGGGFIERSYVPCGEDGVATSGDLCWKTDNATISFAGHSGLLVRDSATGTWRLQGDQGTRVEKLTGASNGGNGAEYWKLTTTDGTQYLFGRTANSGWTVPVFGNNAGEPCHGATFAASACAQVWRWNLDYVVDAHGDAESFTYAPETNRYSENGTTPVGYTRGGQLSEIDYGFRDGSVAQHPQRVLIDLANRCTTTVNCDSAHPTLWPDVPWDQNCPSTSTCTGQVTPTFWSIKMIAKIHAQLLSGTTYADVDTWTLTHAFPATGDGTSPALGLTTIGHTGTSGAATITTPNIVLHMVQTQNRVSAVGGLVPLDKYRISSIDTDTGATITVSYVPTQCSPTHLPAAAESNTMRCFPQRWTPVGAPAKLDWFHKYVVSEVSADPRTGGTGDLLADTTFYDYPSNPGWRYDTSPTVPDSKRTWSVYAGYSTVRIRHGDQNTASQQETTTYLFFRGLDGDRAAPAGGTKTAAVTASDGSVVPDSLWLAGRVREQTTFNGNGGARVANTISTAWASAVTADDGVHQARMVRDGDAVTRTALSAGGNRITETRTDFDTDGRPITVDDLGDTATAADDRCTRTSYATNTTAWLKDFPAEVSVVGRTCAQTPSLPGDAISDTRTFYDASTTLGAGPARGDATRVDVAASYTGATPVFQTTTLTGYDPLGRPTTVTDPRTGTNRTTTTAYTPTPGPLTQTVVTNPLGWTTTTSYNPAWGVPTAVVDQNGHRTDLSYDALGRRTQVWLPDRPKATNPTPSIGYAYTLSTTAPNAVATSTITATGGAATSYALYDGLLRPRQTQAPSEGGGIMLTDTFYDNAGRAARGNDLYFATGTPSATLLIPTLSTPSSSRTVYDGAGRIFAVISLSSGAERWRTGYGYGGDHVDTTPPAGGTPTTTYTDARGHTSRLLQYHAATPTGAADETDYGYDHAGRMTAMTDPAGNHWTWTFDVLGRQTSAHDPDTGTTTTSYDPAGRIATTTDARNSTLAYSYDTLDRKTGEFVTSTAGTQLTSYTYDTLAKGQLTSATRFVGTDAYTSAVTGYDAADRPTGQTITIPASAGVLAGSYTTSLFYMPDGSPSAQVDPAEGGLPAETIRYSYSGLGNVSGLFSASGSYLSGVTYTHLGQIGQTTQSQSAGSEIATNTFDAGTARLTEHLTQRIASSGAVVSDHVYTYANAGQITSDTNNDPNAGVDRQCFRYDYLQRLTTAWTPSTSDCATNPTSTALAGPAPYWTSYTYDLTGNRTTATAHAVGAGPDVTDTYSYPAPGAARPHAVTTVAHSGAGTDSYGYDAAGNTTTTPGQTLGYDAEGHLGTVTTTAGAQNRIYAADGNLLLQTDATGATLYLGDTELHAAPAAAAASGVRTYTAAGLTLAERTTTAGVAGSRLVFLDTTPQHTATATVDTATNAVTRRYFDPFGNPRGTLAHWPDQHGYLNAPADPTSHLTHLGARDYNPTLGRFLTVDPLLDSGDPQQMNGYAYADNNPTTNSDPAGTMPQAGGGECSAGHNCDTGPSAAAPPPAPGGGWSGWGGGDGGAPSVAPDQCGGNAPQASGTPWGFASNALHAATMCSARNPATDARRTSSMETTSTSPNRPGGTTPWPPTIRPPWPLNQRTASPRTLVSRTGE